MRHPVDGSSWKEFDKKYLNFSREPRNVHLGLAADGFNPFGNMSLAHSTWPVVLTTYNLPPWLCMKESSFMLSLLIPGPKSPGKDTDVVLKPLVYELKHLWQKGVRIEDAETNTFFTMKAVLLWTINDFPARSSLSGWSGQGYKACPTCNEDTPSMHVTNKVVYVGHCRFLHANHAWRKSLDFNGEPETRSPPKQFSSADIEDQLSRLLYRVPGKHPDFGGVKRKREDFELNWNKRSIFFELEYLSSLQLKHNLDFCIYHEAHCGGPVCMRWMYPFERYMKKLKHYVRNKARPEGSIAEGYVAEEALSFCSMYLRDVQTRFNRPDRNEDAVVELSCGCLNLNVARLAQRRSNILLSTRSSISNVFSLFLLGLYFCRRLIEFKYEHPQDDVKTKFPKWFLGKLYSMKVQNSPEFHPELYALLIGAEINAFTYSACIVNGVRFMVRGRDVERTTQNSGVLAEGVNNEKYYGQVEEIIELCYGNGYSTVLFQCKWFDTRRGVRHGNQNNNHRWVVENVNHRKIWDLPTLNDGRVENAQNVDNDLVENLDVVHNNSSSNCLLSIDFTQYLLNTSSHVTVGEKSSEVNPPTVTANTLSDGESDNDEDDFEYDTKGSEADTKESEGEFD
ncbi:uncharacterized protein LOC143566278 [Bidens hawaiensis]|uniref:uncharacterized protein LOC143566278 n=1 Tax=Bidens hawaiensis TaxID=980011 RepID=UPI00404A7C07